MNQSKTEKLNSDLIQYEKALLFYTPIYRENIEKYDYCHRAKKSKQFNGQDLEIIKLQESQSKLIIREYKHVMKSLEKRRMKIKKKLGIKDDPQNLSQPGNE